ncbi:MAG: HPr kinase/phosphorylase [Caulobacteraceae bacterium]
MNASAVRHAGLIARRVDGLWRGALIEGPSGSGKSDLALRALGQGFRLVSDDRTVVFASGGRLYGRAPAVLAGLIEVRAIDVVGLAAVRLAEIVLAVRCLERADRPPRISEGERVELCGLEVPIVSLWPFELSAGVKLAIALEHLGAQRQAEYQAPRSRAATWADGRAPGLLGKDRL